MTAGKHHTPCHVGILGSYGGLNLGDEAILQSIMARLRRTLPVRFTIFSRDAEDTLARHPGERAVPARELTQQEVRHELQALDLLILGGGGLLYDGEVRHYVREVMIAHELGVPVMVYAISAGPLNKASNHKLIAEALEPAAAITVRDRLSKKILEDAGVQREITVTADPALLMEPEPLPESLVLREEDQDGKHLIAVSVREPGGAAPDLDPEQYHSILASVADYMIDRYDAHLLFVPMERKHQDLQQSHAVLSMMLSPQRARVVQNELTPGQVLSLLGKVDFAVGMRLHFLIFAALRQTPFVALPYSPKVTSFIEDFGLSSPPIQLINTGRLIAHVDTVWDTRLEQVERLKERLPEIRARAERNNTIALELLRALTRRDAEPKG